jgi:hypothetical protein
MNVLTMRNQWSKREFTSQPKDLLCIRIGYKTIQLGIAGFVLSIPMRFR